ncbi:MAG: membrane protein insertase YidC, partial [Deltaproteobacteria bacterium]|nr:membrane protein insertase YidC [Deltaproteobacteria bacterium]
MEQRMWLAITLSMAVLLGYYMIFPPPAPRPPAAKAPASEAPAAQNTTPAVTPPSAALQARDATPAPVLRAPSQGRRIPVETPLYLAELDTAEGVLVSFRLKHYRDAKANIDWGDVIPALRTWISKTTVDGDAPVEMVHRFRKGHDVFGVRFQGEDSLTERFRQVIYTTDVDAVHLVTGANDPGKLVLTGVGPDGLTVEKTFTFYRDNYLIGYSLSVINRGTAPKTMQVVSQFGEGPAPTAGERGSHAPPSPIWRLEKGVQTEDPEDVKPGLAIQDPQWVGIGSPYFLSAAAPRSKVERAYFDAEEIQTTPDIKRWVASYRIDLPQVALQPDKMISSEFQMYLGPKATGELTKFGSRLDEALNLTLEVLALPMLALMRWFHSFSGNWGVAIILLTVVVRVVLFPFTYKGMLSIKRMQKLQPKFVTLREKYKNDKERLNKEMMLLYKRYKMNPLGGCLPILLQIPVFFALYSALQGAIELRHTAFIGWVTDLSAMDGLYIMPVFMGASMIYQMRLSPSSPDPVQAKIMQWMPVVFTFFMFQFP